MLDSATPLLISTETAFTAEFPDHCSSTFRKEIKRNGLKCVIFQFCIQYLRREQGQAITHGDSQYLMVAFHILTEAIFVAMRDVG